MGRQGCISKIELDAALRFSVQKDLDSTFGILNFQKFQI